MGKNKNPKRYSVKDYGRIMTIEYASNCVYLYREDVLNLLHRENMDSYASGDWRVDLESVVDIYLRKSEIDSEAVKLIGDLYHLLVEFHQSKEREILWSKAAECSKKFSKKFSAAQYFSIVRKIIMSNTYSLYLYPVWIVLDFEYCPNGIFIGDGEDGPTSAKIQFKLNNIAYDVAFCYMSACNVKKYYENDEVGLMKLYGITTEYFTSKGSTIKQLAKLDDSEDTNMANFLLAAGNYCAMNTITNKFYFDNHEPIDLDNVVKYALTARFIGVGKERQEAYTQINNVLYEIPADIFTKRKYIIRDTEFPKLVYRLGDFFDPQNDESQDSIPIQIENIRVCERTAQRSDGNYYMIYMEYSVLGARRTIPICIDNFTATMGAMNLIDCQALFMLFGIYGLLEEISNVELKYVSYNDKLDKIKEIIGEYEYKYPEPTGKEHTKGYHQTKEVYVEAFVRRLPAGQKASEQAKELAKQYRVDLGDDHTIVSPYIRNKGREGNG